MWRLSKLFVERLREDLDTTLEARVPEFEALLQSLLRTQCWLPYSPALLCHNLPYEIVPRGIELEIRLSLEHERKREMSWRL